MSCGGRGATLAQGWLHKRGPSLQYGWKRRWCILEARALLYYSDDRLWEQKGDVPLTASTCIVSFSDEGAPGDSAKHRHRRPYGFAIETHADSGRRRIYYFDAFDASDQERWIAAISACTMPQWLPATLSPRMGLSLPYSEQVWLPEPPLSPGSLLSRRVSWGYTGDEGGRMTATSSPQVACEAIADLLVMSDGLGQSSRGSFRRQRSSGEDHTSSRLHAQERSEQLERRFLDAVEALESLEAAVQAGPVATKFAALFPARPKSGDKSIASAQREECNRLVGSLERLSEDAMQHACDRDVPGALDVFNRTAGLLERVGALLSSIKN